MKFLKRIFGAPKTIERIIDGVDESFFTAQERAENGAKMAEWYLRYLEASAPQNLARRLVAFIVVGIWAVLVLFGVAVYRFDKLWSEFTFQVLADVVLNPFLMVMGFYFATHVLRAYNGQKAKKDE